MWDTKTAFAVSSLKNIRNMLVTSDSLRHYNDAEAIVTKEKVDKELNDLLLSLLMTNLGYRIPNGRYSLEDYSAFCEWLGANEKNGNQRWEDI